MTANQRIPSEKRRHIEEMLHLGERSQDIADITGASIAYINEIRKKGDFPPAPPPAAKGRTGIRSAKRMEIERRLRGNERSIDIARDVGVSFSYVTAIQRAGGYPQSRVRRGPAPSKIKPPRPPRPPTKRQLIEARLREGARSKVVADEMGVDISYVSHVRKLAGLERTPPAPKKPSRGRLHGPPIPPYQAYRDDLLAALDRDPSTTTLAADLGVPEVYAKRATREWLARQATTRAVAPPPPPPPPPPAREVMRTEEIRLAVRDAVLAGGYTGEIARRLGVATTYVSRVRDWIREDRINPDGTLKPLESRDVVAVS